MDKHRKFEKTLKSAPHVVILGAGASVAAIPQGDLNGVKTSVMDGFLEKLNMKNIIDSVGLTTNSTNLEDIYSELFERTDCKQIRIELESKIHNFFSSLKIPSTPTVYDFLLLSLRKKDLVATFNWDPLLLQAYQRSSNITDNLPDLAFLHGNVMAGFCDTDKRGGLAGTCCQVCGKTYQNSRLLYPIKQKNYNSDLFILDSWNALKNYLKKAYMVTIFGYSAPKTDVEAISILQQSWGVNTERELEDFEFIDKKTEDEIINTWETFIHTHHYSYYNSFFESSMAKFPRRTTEELFDRTMNCIFTNPINSLKENMSFAEIEYIVNLLNTEEKNNPEPYITLKNSI